MARLLALLESERRYYSEIVATLPVAVTLLSVNRDILSVNRAFRDLVGIPVEELAKLRIEDVVRFPGLSERFRQAAAGGENRSFHMTSLLETRRGLQKVRLEAQRSQSWEEGGEQEFLVALLELGDEDTESAAPTQEPGPGTRSPAPSRFPAVVWQLDASLLRVVAASGSGDVIPGLDPSQLLESGGFPGSHVHDRDRERYAAFYRELASGERSAGQCEYRGAASGQPSTWLLDTALAETNDQGSVTSIYVTTIAVGEKRLRDRQKEQSAALDSQAHVASRIAHNCNNLLMIVSGYCEELSETHTGDAPLEADLGEIQKACARLANLVTRLQASSRKAAPPRARFDLRQLLREVQARLGPASKFTFHPPAEPLLVEANRGDVDQTITLLAALAGGNEPVAVRTLEINWPSGVAGEKHALPAGMYAAVTFALNADEDTLRRAIIEPDLEAHDDPGAPPSLAALHRSLQLNGAALVSWDDGGGQNDVLLLIPMAVGEPPPEPGLAAPAPPEPQTVLIVEDEKGILALMQKILTRQGYQAIGAESSEKALRLAAESTATIHLLVADLQIGVDSGRQLAETLRATRPDMRVLYVSGYTDDPEIQEAVETGKFPPGVGYLQKPFTLESLVGRVRDLLKQ